MNKYSVDYTNILAEYTEKIIEAVKKLKCTPIMICRTTNHPADDKLFVVLAQYDNPHPVYNNPYCVWDASVFGSKASLFYGHYGLSFRSAMQCVLDKTRDLNKEEE